MLAHIDPKASGFLMRKQRDSLLSFDPGLVSGMVQPNVPGGSMGLPSPFFSLFVGLTGSLGGTLRVACFLANGKWPKERDE
jgi:hypothetical protein